ncbi:MAG TPA: hypothetical protein VIY48_18045 [Candidatus Paceibacterota bacterium]
MGEILGPDGSPARQYIDRQSQFANKKAAPPKTGEAFGNWAGRDDLQIARLPGGGIVQFDLSKLTIEDYRNMRDHYQVNASLAVLSFMQHQSDWHIECEDKKIADLVEEQLRKIWTQLNRGLSTSNWAGYSPMVLQWENVERNVVLDKIKDLAPEECEVNWKLVEGWAPPGRVKPKFKVYDGIKQWGQPGWPIPVENSLWYPTLMEHGDYYGRKLLRPAFQSWFFSILIHLFANRYFERFGEPTPVGRAPFDDEISIEGTNVKGNVYMAQQIQQLRNRSVVVLPNERVQVSDSQSQWEYELEYLESQMRGADFERYLTRLDEEVSIALFTPILLLRTADVGSYNLGQGHERIYQMMINAMNADRKDYIDKYVNRRIVDFNFGVNAPDARIVFRKMGNVDATMLKEMVVALINGNNARPDLEELGQAIGMNLKEIEQTLEPPTPPADPAQDPNADPAADPGANAGSASAVARGVGKEVVNRVRPQIEAAFRSGEFRDKISMGYKHKMERAYMQTGHSSPISAVNELYGRLDNWVSDVTSSMKPSDFAGPEEFMDLFERVLNNELENA